MFIVNGLLFMKISLDCAREDKMFEIKSNFQFKANALALIEGKILFINCHGFKPVAIDKKIWNDSGK